MLDASSFKLRPGMMILYRNQQTLMIAEGSKILEVGGKRDHFIPGLSQTAFFGIARLLAGSSGLYVKESKFDDGIWRFEIVEQFVPARKEFERPDK